MKKIKVYNVLFFDKMFFSVSIYPLITPYGLLCFTKYKALFIVYKLALKSSQNLKKQKLHHCLNRVTFMAGSTSWPWYSTPRGHTAEKISDFEKKSEIVLTTGLLISHELTQLLFMLIGKFYSKSRLHFSKFSGYHYT